VDILPLIPRDSYSRTCICEIPSSNLGQGNNYFEFRLFRFHLQSNIGIVSQTVCRSLNVYVFTIHDYGPYLYVYQLTISMEQYPPREASGRWDNQEIPHCVWNSNISHRLRKSLQLSLFWTRWIQAPCSCHIALTPILTISSNLLTYFRNYIFLFGFQAEILCAFLVALIGPGFKWPPHLIVFGIITKVILLLKF
jgi:hypothetical protein